MVHLLKRLLPFVILVILMGAIYSLGWHEYLTFEALKENREYLLDSVQRYPLQAAVIYVMIYIAVVTFSLPGATVATLAGGFLFGHIWGVLYTVVAATTGATLLFLIARSSLGLLLRSKAAPWFHKMEKGFQKNQFSYLLTIRLIPLFPFFIVNLVPAFLGMRTVPYILATVMGIIPGTAVYTAAGVGLGSVFARNATFSLQAILTPEILLAFCGLAVLSFLPVIYGWVKNRR